MPPWDETDERPRPAGYGGDWRGARPSFDDPMTWALGVARVRGITVRVHVFFLVFLLAMLARSASATTDIALGLVPTALGLLALFTVVLVHEFGHAIACRRSGGTADEILIWPLGGLASCHPPDRPRAHLATAVGGPLVNVAIIAVLTPLLGLWLGQWWGLAIPNPFDLGAALQRSEFGDGLRGWGMLLLHLVNTAAWILLVFNLIPMFPLDGGRILQAILWPRVGYARSMRIACRSGLVGELLIALVALVTDSVMLLAIALFGGVVSFTTARQIDAERDFLGFEPDPSELAAMEDELEPEPPASRPRAATQAGAKSPVKAASGKTAAPDPDAEIDQILAKIARSGIDSLTADERAQLARATERKRTGG